jgi:hypothetical protein
MEQSSLWEANRHSEVQKFSNLLRNPKVYDSAPRKTPPLMPTLSGREPGPAVILYAESLILILSASHFRLGKRWEHKKEKNALKYFVPKSWCWDHFGDLGVKYRIERIHTEVWGYNDSDSEDRGLLRWKAA